MSVRPSLNIDWSRHARLMRYFAYAHILIRHPAIRKLRSGPAVVVFAVLIGKILLRFLVPASVYLAARYFELFDDAAIFLLDSSSLVHLVAGYCGPVVFACALTRCTLREGIAPAYLQLPVSRMVVTTAKQVSGLMHVGCLSVFAALLGVGNGVVLTASEGAAVAWDWIAPMLSWCILAYALGSWGRYVVSSVTLQLGIFAAISGAILFDAFRGGVAAHVLSAFLDAYVIQTGFTSSLLAAAAIVLLLLLSARKAAHMDTGPTLRPGHIPGRFFRGVEGPIDRSDVIRCMMLEVRLLRRCGYPRYVFRGMGIMIIFLLLLAIAHPEFGEGLVTPVFIIGGLPVSYAQLAFAWNSPHFDGLMHLPLEAEVHVTARTLLSLLLTTASLGLAMVLVPFNAADLSDVLAAYVFVCGTLVLPSISLSMRRSKSVDLDVTGFGNLRSFSWQFYIGGFVIWYGIAGLTALTSDFIARSVLAGTGILGLLLLPAGIQLLARRLNDDLATMAGRFRIPT